MTADPAHHFHPGIPTFLGHPAQTLYTQMATAENTELIDRFEEFYRNYYRNEIGELAQKYPNDQKSLYIDWDDLYRFDPDLADDYRTKPSQLQEFAEEALRLYDLPVDVSLGQAHVRVRNLPESEDIRAIRHEHHGNLIAVRGIVRKATDVRPKVTEAAFECQRCGTLTRIPQAAGDFQEPHECQGCERQGPFRLNTDQSQFIDAQKIRVQESPEGLRGGETPQAIDVSIEDDITGKVTAGDHVRATGVLKLDQQGSDQDKSPMFDIYMDGVSIVIEDEQFEDMEITDADKKELVELSNEPDIYEEMVGAIAPSIYGYEKEKLAMMLQLFSGVTKELPDGSRIRGDLHMLLIGDPGTGKCQKFDTKVVMGDGTERQLGELVESQLDNPEEIDDGVYQEADFAVQTVGDNGSVTTGTATKVWKREAPETLYEIQTQSGRSVTVTPSHPLFIQSDLSLSARRADELSEGEFLAVPGRLRGEWDNTLDVAHRSVDQPNANTLNTPERVTTSLSRLLGYVIAEGYITEAESNGCVTVTNADEEIIEDTMACLESLGLRVTRRTHHTNDSVELICCASAELVDFFRGIEPAMLELSAAQRVPECLFRATPANKRAFLRAYVDSEGTVSQKEREIAVGSMSRELLEGVQTLLLTFGITSHLEARSGGSYRLRISGEDFVAYLDQVGFVTARKTDASAAFDGTSRNTNTEIIPGLSTDLRRIREALELSQFDCGVPRTTYQHYERGDRNPGRESLLNVVETFEQRLQWLRDARERVENGEWDDVEEIRTELNISQADLAADMEVTQTAVSYYERNDAIPDGGAISGAKETVLQRIDRGLSVSTDVQRLRTLATADVAWDPIESIEKTETDEEWVYDLEIEGTHSYVSNGVVSHNSQMLSYIQNIAPRSVYTSGKGSSSAGLTAAAVRDDFGDGQQWTLEAGALVLADQGIAAIDELDKMSCVTGDTLVHGADGIARIRDLAHDAAETGAVESLSNGRTIREFGDLRVWTMTDDGRLVTRPVTAIHEYDAPDDLTRVTLETGERLTATADHPFFVREDGERVERHAADLDSGDWVYVPEKLRERATDGGETVRVPGKQYADAVLDAGMNLETYDGKRLPESVTRSSRASKAAFLRALADSEGSVDERHVRIHSSSYELLLGAKQLLVEFGISSQLQTRERAEGRDVYALTITAAESLSAFTRHVGFTLDRKQRALEAAVERVSGDRTILDVVPSCGDLLADCRESLRLYQSECGLDDATYCNFETEDANISFRCGRTVLEAFETRRHEAAADTERLDGADWSTLESLRKRYHVTQSELAEGTDYSQPQISRLWGSDGALRAVIEGRLSDIVESVASTDLGALREFVHGDIKWRRVDSVETVQSGVDDDRIDGIRGQLTERLDEIEARQTPSVYDLTVAGTHNFVANGMVVHNSEDRSAMHEALEQQRISISKAGINATLKSRCSLLGAANPKYGRFDQYEPIGEQINLEPALISRFDLIFTVTDEPDEEADRNLAEHIVQTNYAGELHTHRTNNPTSNFSEEEVDTVTDEVAPTIEPEILRKYIAYAKRNCFPTLTEEAKETIEDFYVDLRMRGQDEDAPVPVTARKLEALVRLAEASARIRLSDTVEEEDADRAVDIALYCMKQIGIDPETGEFDADVVETGQSKSQRDRIKDIKQIVKDIEQEYDEGAPVDVIIERAEEAGVEKQKAEHEIEKLKTKGELYEPSHDHLRTT